MAGLERKDYLELGLVLLFETALILAPLREFPVAFDIEIINLSRFFGIDFPHGRLALDVLDILEADSGHAVGCSYENLVYVFLDNLALDAPAGIEDNHVTAGRDCNQGEQQCGCNHQKIAASTHNIPPVILIGLFILFMYTRKALRCHNSVKLSRN